MTQEQQATANVEGPKPPVDLPVLGQFAGYDVLGRLALGGMAEILLVRHTDTDGATRFLVVKRILPHFEQDNDFVQMFLDEARIGMQLKHPNICQFHQFGADEGSHFIVMEWVNGMPLGRLIRKARKQGGVGLPIALRIGTDIARALHYAHTADDEHGEPFNMIHRDVSPHNIMIGYEGSVKLLDFGIAKADHRAHKTQAGVVKGKFAYMAPEQCTGAQSDHRLDIFALGVCIFETLTGRSLYRRQTEAATMRAVMMDPVPSLKDKLPDVPDELDQILQKALAKEAGDRFATAEELADALEKFGKSTQQFARQREVSDFIQKAFPEEFSRGPRVDTVPFGASICVDMHHDNDSSKSYVAQVAGVRELEVETGGALDLSHLLDAGPAPAAAPASTTSSDDDPSGPRVTRRPTLDSPKLRAKSPVRGPPVQKRSWKGLVTLLVILVGAGGFAMVKFDGMKYVKGLLRDKGPPEVALSENPLLRQHGARILVASSPPGAKIYLDGKEQGVTPVALTGLMQGEYRIRIETPGFASWSTTAKVSTGETAGVTARLLGKQGGAQPGAYGRVDIETNPPSDVFIGGDLLGRTPMKKVYVPLGRVTLEFELNNGRKVVRRVNVKPDRVSRARFDFRKEAR
ncbi:MAG: serine/threonine protein kinase [Deltaproteobacteria bacterium]|nr:serine/threonine protein kinase [Deltaproteobacteria bacterium]